MNPMNPIKQIRKDRHLTRMETAVQTGVSYSGLQRIECGVPNKLQPRTLEPLAKFAGVDPETLQADYQAWVETQRVV